MASNSCSVNDFVVTVGHSPEREPEEQAEESCVWDRRQVAVFAASFFFTFGALVLRALNTRQD